MQIVELLGGATSSRVYAALDPVNNVHVCLKVIKNDKDYFDQSLNEIKLLQCAPATTRCCARCSFHS